MMVKKITTILLLIVVLTSLFTVVFSSLALANRPNYTVCWYLWYVGPHCWEIKCCSGYSQGYSCGTWRDTSVCIANIISK